MGKKERAEGRRYEAESDKQRGKNIGQDRGMRDEEYRDRWENSGRKTQ